MLDTIEMRTAPVASRYISVSNDKQIRDTGFFFSLWTLPKLIAAYLEIKLNHYEVTGEHLPSFWCNFPYFIGTACRTWVTVPTCTSTELKLIDRTYLIAQFQYTIFMVSSNSGFEIEPIFEQLVS